MAGTPLSAIGATAADHSVGTQLAADADWPSGWRVLDRAWPIVVHSRPRHKGGRYSLVTTR